MAIRNLAYCISILQPESSLSQIREMIQKSMPEDFRCFVGIAISALILIGEVTTAKAVADEDLVALAHKEFPDVISGHESETFDKLFRNTENGEKVDLTPNLSNVTKTQDLKILTDPVYSEFWEKNRVIKAEWLKWLCINPTASSKVTSRGVEIAGARIEGKVDLAWAKIQFPLRTFKCAFADDIVLNRANIGSLQLQSTCIQSLDADYLAVERDVSFVDGFRATGRVWLRHATINGTLTCDGGQFINPGQMALDLEGAKIGSVLLRHGLRVEGQANFYSALINGSIDCENGFFVNPGDIALNLEASTVTGEVLLWNNFTADGQVTLAYIVSNNVVTCDNGHFINPGQIALDLEGSKIGSVLMRNSFEADGEVKLYTAAVNGSVECDAGQFHNPGGIALNLEACRITGEVLLWNKFAADGEVRLYSSTVNGALVCNSGQFRNPGGFAIDLEGAKTGSILMRDGFRSEGDVWLYHATIDGSFECDGGQFVAPGREALNLEGAKTGTILLRHGFRAEGKVQLYQATIDGSLECDGGQFINPKGEALSLTSVKIGNIFLRADFEAQGEVTLEDATINGVLDCFGGHFLNPGLTALNAALTKIGGSVYLQNFEGDGLITFEDAEIGDEFRLANGSWHDKAFLNLSSAKAKTLFNHPTGWPSPNGLLLNAFSFDELNQYVSSKAETQKSWIALQRPEAFSPQPFEETAKVLRSMGRPDEADKVLVEKNERYGNYVMAEDRREGNQNKASRDSLWYNWFGKLIGYGYYWWNAIYVSLLVIVVGAVLFKIGYHTKYIIPTDKDALPGGILRPGYPLFNAFVYSLETFVPLVKLRLEEYWIPDASRGPVLIRFDNFPLVAVGSFFRIYLWVHISLGWILTSVWVAGLTGLLRG